jgi:hypothetical protein
VEGGYLKWLGRYGAVEGQLAAYERELLAFGDDLFGSYTLPEREQETVLNALHGRYLYLLHRHDQLLAEVRRLASEVHLVPPLR